MKGITALILQGKVDGQIVHHKTFAIDTDKTPPAEIAQTKAALVSQLQTQYPPDRYEILDEGYNSADAFYRDYPELKVKD